MGGAHKWAECDTLTGNSYLVYDGRGPDLVPGLRLCHTFHLFTRVRTCAALVSGRPRFCQFDQLSSVAGAEVYESFPRFGGGDGAPFCGFSPACVT